MTRLFLLFSLLLSDLLLSAQPATDIYLCDLRLTRKDVSITNPVNITNRKGYDNQPAFHPDSELLYYVSADSTGETDIMLYDCVSKKTAAMTNTPEREYSPSVTPDKKFISCIIQRSDGAQDLGRYPVSGGNPEVLVDTLICGYYAWCDNNEVAVFVLPAPFTLHMINVKTGADKIVTDSIGRSLHTIPGERAVSFVQKKSTGTLIQKWDGDTQVITTLAEPQPAPEHDMAWTPDRRIIMSDGKKLYWNDRKKESGWREISVPGNFPAGAITRLAVNRAGDKVAVVISE
jgi:hypothetical protein